MKRRIVLLGPPASGKGTIADGLRSEFELPIVSPGSLLRAERAAGTTLGLKADAKTSALAGSGTLEPGEMFSVALTEYEYRHFSLVDVVQSGCSKGTALADWAARRGLAASEVMAVGDNLNDLEMLEFAGTPVVMANALPELKARGWAATSSNDDAGVARAIETFVFAEASY